ncbi:MAG: SAM-dependent methyltransferase, partial [Actinomycetota bacterium]|nr:SAM-dependent methyltransferase [Actinomycetota bacterium]
VHQAARDHRAFVGRALRLLTGERGVDQFIDLGSGLPTVDNTHQIVQRYNAESRVIYVDNDPVVQAHGRALLEENDRTHMAGCDLSDPSKALSDPDVAPFLDRDRPVAVMMAAIVHHVPDDEQALSIVRDWMAAVPSGSYLVFSHQCDPEDGSPASALARTLTTALRDSGVGSVHRTRPEIEKFFDGLEYVPPGLTLVHQWWPDGPRLLPLTDVNFTTVGAVARKP